MASNDDGEITSEELTRQIQLLELQEKKMRQLVEQRIEERKEMEEDNSRMQRQKQYMMEMVKENEGVEEEYRTMMAAQGPSVVNTEGNTLGMETGGNADPLTGGSSYSTDGLQGDELASAAGGCFDPLTGSGAYTSGSGGVQTGHGGGPPPDPWMQGAYKTEDSTDTKVEGKNSYFPLNEFLLFDGQLKGEAIVNKLKEFNNAVSAELQLENSILEQLPTLATSPTPDSSLLPALTKVLSWPDAHVFPALDLLRSFLLNPGSQAFLLDKSFLDQIFSSCLKHVDKTSSQPCQMLALRALNNMFTCVEGETLLRTYIESVISRVFERLFPIVGDNKNIQIAAASLLLNYSVSVNKKFDDETQVQLLSALSINFLTFIHDLEAGFRTLVATGTLLTASPEAVEYAKQLETKDSVRLWRMMEGPPKMSECAQFIENML